MHLQIPNTKTNNFHELNVEIHNLNREQKRIKKRQIKKINQIGNNLRGFTPYKRNKQNLKQNTKQSDNEKL